MNLGSFLMVFSLGFLSCTLIFSLSMSTNIEFPFGSGNMSVHAPNDYLTEDNIVLMDDRVIIFLDDPSISRYKDSGSMSPVLDEKSNGIRVVPESVNEISVGDIITYQRSGRLIVHRVVEKGEDLYGVYFIMAGDNNNFSDGKIRFEDVKYKTVVLLY